MRDPAGPTAASARAGLPAGTTACIRFSKYDLLCYCDPKPQGPLHLPCVTAGARGSWQL